MNIRLLASVATALLVGSPLIHAQADSAPEHHTEIGKHMEKVSKGVKKLRSQISDSSQNDSSLQIIADIRANLSDCLTLTPEKEKDLPADQQPDFHAKFQAQMKEFIGKVDKLADLVKAGDNAGAADQLKVLLKDERTDHKQFRKPHDE